MLCACADYGECIRISTIRSDHGRKNIEVWRFVVEQHGSASSVIPGSSTHNERIERLWRDVDRCVVSIFYEMFFSLENEGKLNEIDLYCRLFTTHYFFPGVLYRIVEQSPYFYLKKYYSFVRGALEQNITPQQPREVQPGITSTGNVPLPHASSAVAVPRSHFTPCAALTTQVTQNISPLVQSDDFGYAVYCETVDIVGRHLQISCNDCAVINPRHAHAQRGLQ